MPYSVDPPVPSQGFVDVRLKGTVNTAEVGELGDQLTGLITPWSRVLFDDSSLENPTELLSMFVKAPCRTVLFTNVRQAVIVADNAAAPARSWVRHASPGSAGAQAFSSRDAALPWLLAHHQSTTHGS